MSKSGPWVSLEELAGSSPRFCCGGLGGGGSIGAKAVEGELRARVGMGCGVGAGLLMKTGTIQGMGMGTGRSTTTRRSITVGMIVVGGDVCPQESTW